MKKLILILGDLASGKSTTADILSRKYSIPSLKKDTVKEILGDTVGFNNREENLKLSRATFEILLHAFERVSLTGGDLILESNFREAELDRLIALAEERGYQILSLLLALTLIFTGCGAGAHNRGCGTVYRLPGQVCPLEGDYSWL